MSCLGLLEKTITLFEWTNISVALFECLGLLEVNYGLLGIPRLNRDLSKLA